MSLAHVMIMVPAVAIPLIGALYVWDYRHVRNGEWHTYRGNRMRRMGPDGRWQIRPAAPGENDDHIHNFSM